MVLREATFLISYFEKLSSFQQQDYFFSASDENVFDGVVAGKKKPDDTGMIVE